MRSEAGFDLLLCIGSGASGEKRTGFHFPYTHTHAHTQIAEHFGCDIISSPAVSWKPVSRARFSTCFSSLSLPLFVPHSRTSPLASPCSLDS